MNARRSVRGLLAGATYGVALSLASPSLAQSAGGVPFVTMTGEAVVEAAPDVATLRLSTVTEGPSISQATETNAQRMSAVLASVLATGVPRSQVKTEAISVQPFYATSKDGRVPQITGYTVRNTLSVRTKGTQALGALIEKAGAAGANEISGPDFSIDDNPESVARARANAALDAKARATAYASALGIELGRVLSVSEGDVVRMPRPFAAEMRAMTAGASAAPPVESGLVDIRARVTVTWEIAQRP